MQNPELYIKGNSPQRNDTVEMLSNYLHLVQWRHSEDETVLDVGCGTGDVTWEILKPRLPRRAHLLGADIAPNMLEYAARKYSDLKTFLFDICTFILPQHMNEAIDHVFSFYCLHWVVNQRQAFQNIYDMLKPGGDSFTYYLGSHPFNDAFVNLFKTKKWENYTLDVTKVFNLHKYEDDIDDNLKNILLEIGFNVLVYEIKNRHLKYTNLQKLKADIIAIYPDFLRIPEDLRNEFIDDIVEELFKLKSMKQINVKISDDILVPYRLICIFATKPKLK